MIRVIAAVILLLTVLNGAFAMSEMAIVSSRKARLQQQASRGDARAETALAMAASPTQVLSTGQIGITLVGQVAGVFRGATIAGQLTAAVVVDQLGILGIEKQVVTVPRIAGIALLAAGTFLVVKY